MEAEYTGFPFREIQLQGAAHAGKGDFIPRHLFLGEQPHFQAFLASAEDRLQQAGAEKQVHLADVRHIEQGIQRVDFDLGQCFLVGLARRGLGCGFAVFHETRGQRPEAVARFDGAAAEENLVFPFGNAADHQFRVLVVNGVADIADMARQVIPGRDAQADFGAAVAAVIHVNAVR
jgi:hypothetical protein